MRRRRFLTLSAAAVAGCGVRGTRPKVVIVGGGFGGATCARALRTLAPELDVTLVERRSSFLTGPFSNAVVAGLRTAASIRFGPSGLVRDGVRVRLAEAKLVDPTRKEVRLADGETLAADWLVIAPGVRLLNEEIDGLDPERMPSAWTGDTDVETLRARVKALPQGATVLIGAPPNPYRCPPGPYERASLLAHLLAPKGGKVILADAKDDFTKRALFRLEWDVRYPGTVTWISRQQGGRVVGVADGEVRLEGGERLTPDLVSIVPPQRAAALAQRSDLTDTSGWCPVSSFFESTRHPDVYVLGDAAQARPMPKSATCAHGQAKLAALDIVRKARGQVAHGEKLINTCYSLTTDRHAISVSAVYTLAPGQPIAAQTSATSALAGTDEDRIREGQYARDWFAALTADSFGA